MTASGSQTPLPAEAKAELDAWRAEKDRELRGPQGPLTYLGPIPLTAGVTRVGSGPEDTLRYPRPGVPAAALELLAQDVRVHLRPLVPLVALNGQPAGEADLKPGDLVEVGPIGLRYQGHGPQGPVFVGVDRARPEALDYRGLHYLPIDGRYRVPATVEAPPTGKTLTLDTTQHQQRVLPINGIVHFELFGQAYALEGFQLGDRPRDLFVIFRDRTNGETTYGAGRFLWVKAPVEGRTIVDFNQAWNPLCAYSDAFNCPLAPPENRLPIAIPVGEAPFGHR